MNTWVNFSHGVLLQYYLFLFKYSACTRLTLKKWIKKNKNIWHTVVRRHMMYVIRTSKCLSNLNCRNWNKVISLKWGERRSINRWFDPRLMAQKWNSLLSSNHHFIIITILRRQAFEGGLNINMIYVILIKHIYSMVLHIQLHFTWCSTFCFLYQHNRWGTFQSKRCKSRSISLMLADFYYL